MQIKQDDMSDPQIINLLTIHHAEAHIQNPDGASHSLSLEALRQDDNRLWSAWEGDILLGVGAMRELTADHGELKSVHTARDHRRKGVSAALIAHIITYAQSRGMSRLSLETHPTPGYAPARAFYKRLGFTVCGPFGEYVADPNSVFMTKLL